jgi:hypothetical protein
VHRNGGERKPIKRVDGQAGATARLRSSVRAGRLTSNPRDLIAIKERNGIERDIFVGYSWFKAPCSAHLPEATMIDSFDLQKARLAVEKAKQALKAAEHRFDTECGPSNTKELISVIKDAERRLADARADLKRLRSSATPP